MKPDRAWVRLGSGRRLDLLDPQPGQLEDRDIAVSLSRTYRWGGHSCWDLPLSVAQHSLLVLVLRQQMQPHQPLTPGEALRELLHDADKLTGFDAVAPLRLHLGAEFHALTARLQAAVAARYLDKSTRFGASGTTAAPMITHGTPTGRTSINRKRPTVAP